MPRWFLVGLVALWAASFQQGCEDGKRALTTLAYPPIRDMRRSIAIDPQQVDPLTGRATNARGPDSLAVPTIGRDVHSYDMAPYEVAGVKMVNPVPATEASIARGDSLFGTVCWSCHGKSMAGDGPIAAKFIPPPDLLAETSRGRTDGYLYMYIRHGGAIMPSYGNALTQQNGWDLVNYIRQQQKVSPR